MSQTPTHIRIQQRIDNGDRLQRQLEALALRLTGTAQASREFADEAWTPEDDDSGDEFTVWYLGGGYWRARVCRDSESHSVIGITLINPDRTRDEIATVTEAMRILRVMPGGR